MKLAVLADIHGNWVALQAVAAHIEQWQPDIVVMAGDVVNRGPRPAECLQFVLNKAKTAGWRLVRGNHEDYVISLAHPEAPTDGPAYEVHRASRWTLEQLGRDVTALEAMPFQVDLTAPDGSPIRIVHASMAGNRDGIYPQTSDAELAAKINKSSSLFCAGHTHIPHVRQLNGTLVVNAGSSGLPFDLDTRPAYAQLTWRNGGWQARIVRVSYDLAAAQRDFEVTGYREGAGPLVELVQIELAEAHSMLYGWAIRYQSLALQGKITMEQSVQEYLRSFRK